MELVWSADWRTFAAAPLAILGMVLGLRGGARMVRGFLLPLGVQDKNLRTVRSMRMCLQGIALAAIGFGWWFQWPAMAVAGLVVGFEETIETSIVVWALKQEPELDARFSRPPSRSESLR